MPPTTNAVIIAVAQKDAGDAEAATALEYCIKHAMNGGHFLLRSRRKVRCEVALLFLGYNLKRGHNTLGFKGLMARLDSLSRCFAHFLLRARYSSSFSSFSHAV